jgi:hypothetical protein
LRNTVPQREIMRALLRGLDGWARQGVAPPESRYPKLADGTLTPIASVKFPAIPGVADPRSIPGPGQIRGGNVEMLPHLVPQVMRMAMTSPAYVHPTSAFPSPPTPGGTSGRSRSAARAKS